MKKIRLQNLRSLVDTGYVNVKPITVLVGKNSVGKSTFLRSFPLLKQTMLMNRSEPVLWYSPELVDFGNFKESVNGKDEKKTIDFSYEFDLLYDDIMVSPLYSAELSMNMYRAVRILPKMKRDEVVNTKTSFSFTEDNISRIKIEIFDYSFVISIDKKGKVTKLKVNDMDCPLKTQLNQSDKYMRRELIPRIFVPIDSAKNKLKASYTEKIFDLIIKELSVIRSKKIVDKNFNKLFENIFLSDKREFREVFLNEIKRYSSIVSKYNHLDECDKSDLIDKLYDYYGLRYINLIILVINNYFYEYFDNCQYIAPIRATAQRYYRSQGLSIETITPQGENVPMLLDSMTLAEKEDWNKWTTDRFGIKFVVTKHETNISLKLEKNNEEINLADTGFGYSQLLPILLYAWKTKRDNQRNYYWTSDRRKKIKTLVIEQPELHLHPALQAHLLDVFIELVTYINDDLEFNVVMETHSEAIVNRIGHHILADKVPNLKDHVNIVIFDEIDGEIEINQVSFNERGYLENWPIDFFIPSIKGIDQ